MLSFTTVDPCKTALPVLAVAVCEDQDIHATDVISQLAQTALGFEEFQGRSEEMLALYRLPEVAAVRVFFFGLGKSADVSAESLRAFAGRAVKACIRQNLDRLTIAVPAAEKTGLDRTVLLAALLEGAFLGNHRFDRYKDPEELRHAPLKQIDFLTTAAVCEKFSALPKKIEILCSGTCSAREWVSTPPNDKRPERFCRDIVQAAEKENLKVEVLGAEALEAQGFGALLAVAAGSDSRPSLVILEHRPAGAQKTVALVGKGVTFDSGGLNLKPGEAMDTMKTDMSGAAAVAATLLTAARLDMPVAVVGAIPIVENMPAGNATRPGDIVRSYAGKTIEIGNTDAEGRLILADAMAYVAEKFQPQIMIDLATLTGACVVALGEKMAGVFSEDDALAEAVAASGTATFERCWRLPMPADYKDQLKSDFADLRNIGNTRWGGAVTAALFLSAFVQNTRWAHIDIAGPAYIKKSEAYCEAGGTGFGVRLLCHWLETFVSEPSGS